MKEGLSIKQILGIAFAAIALIFVLMFAGSIGEEVEAGEIVVIQAPFTGTLTTHAKPGWVWQNFGTATHYRKSTQLWFSKPREGDESNRSIPVKWNDGGHATISGSVRWDMPLDPESIIAIHSIFGSSVAIETQLIRTNIEKSIYLTGPLMTSKESYAEKRNDLLFYIEDQASKGVYKTTQKEVKSVDPITNVDKTITVVDILKDSNNVVLRQEASPIGLYHIKLYNLSINSIDYDELVEKQIAAQQQAIMQVQTAIAKAKEAEQKALTVAKEGEAEAAKAKWDQEVIKAKVVTEAQQQLEVQRLNTQTAELYKKQQILEGEGEAAKKRAIMSADGALDPKLAAYVATQEAWATAFGKYTGNVVPTYSSGGNGSGGNAFNWMEVMGMKAARDLGLDMKITNK